MGGFARYPWPKYLANAPFYYNPHYKRAMLFTAIGCLVNIMWVHRFLATHSVSNGGYGSYVDPEHSQAPSQVKLI